eukprot:CAMPEP_0172833668 /NCGR_PEP_ID=MMETSP1075-20121228/24516_1 /TAXON_ID=2916 /ORGANISM="Ceratium fusus, Strain PA161109" /LENGTH=85 /DNA_ID=CAMNT_0013676441 /DNA_START=126 /DNA_END=380 /DNA_ORIENTATION=-
MQATSLKIGGSIPMKKTTAIRNLELLRKNTVLNGTFCSTCVTDCHFSLVWWSLDILAVNIMPEIRIRAHAKSHAPQLAWCGTNTE